MSKLSNLAAVANQGEAMVADTISKNGRSSKSQTSRKSSIVMAITVILVAFSSCASHSGLTANLNNHGTQVVLSKANYKVVGHVRGTASSGISVFGIPGPDRPLISEARKKMLDEANFEGNSRAVVNETVEVNNFNYFFRIVQEKVVTVSGYVVEFTE